MAVSVDACGCGWRARTRLVRAGFRGCRCGADQSKDFVFGHDALGLLGGSEDAINERVGRGDFAFFEPVDDVGAAAQRADFDDLLETEQMRRHAAVDGIR